MFRFLILKISTIKNKIYSENFNRLKNNLIYARAPKVLRYLNLEMFKFWLGKSNVFWANFEFLQPESVISTHTKDFCLKTSPNSPDLGKNLQYFYNKF
jgi:hypothetical protein